MRAFTLVARSLLYRWRTNLAVALGVAVATAVLVGALGAGDSVRYSLRALTLSRLGSTEYALEAADRYVGASMADRLTARLGGRAAALITTIGSASARGGESRASPVQVLGVDADFWSLSGRKAPRLPGPNEAILNERLARQLGVGPGDEILIRVEAGSGMPAEAPLAASADESVAMRLTVAALMPESGLGNFSLRVNQAPPLNVFISRDFLSARLGRTGRTNTVLLAPSEGRSLEQVQRSFASSFQLEDAGLSLRKAGQDWELVSDRVFMEPAAAGAALSEGGNGVLTYFVDRISRKGRSISYAFVSSGAAPELGGALGDGEILLNVWAARELGAAAGDTVSIEYRVPGPELDSPLEMRTERLRVKGVVPIRPTDRTLVPDFPGFTDKKSCTDWDPGVPLDLSRIGPRDQAYWDEYGGSPKAFMSLSSAQRLWGNRFGQLTAVRFDFPETDQSLLAARIAARIPPTSLGLVFAPVRAIGLAAGSHGVDFGQLFLGLSMFLIAASLLLTALLFQLSVEQRVGDIGTLRALGFTPGRIRRLLAAEGALVSLAGSILGAALGAACHRGILAGLRTVWRDAVQNAALVPYLSPASLLIGTAGGFVASLAVIVLATRGMQRVKPARLHGRTAPRLARTWILSLLAGACIAGAAIARAALSPPTSFFASGSLLLCGLLAATALALTLRGKPRDQGLPTIVGMGMANASRRAARSLAVASVLACGIFIVTAVGANTAGTPNPDRRESGTGGFALIAETAVPLSADRERRLSSAELAGAPFTGLRVLEGDDASCLNLNRVQRPRLLGVSVSSMKGRFSFSSSLGDVRLSDPWSLLEQNMGPDTIPAVADESVITWGLGLKLGDELAYVDESGATLKVRLVAGLAGSIFQGSILVGESALVRHFPSSSGHRMLLIEAPAAVRAELQNVLARSLTGSGASLVTTMERLAQLNSVENAYLSVFALLGWLGMLIATLGLAIVVARNTAESGRELALLRAVGFGRRALMRLVLAEHLLPLGLGLTAGIAASALAVSPTVVPPLQIGWLLGPVGAIIASAILCVVVTTAIALRRELLPALRNE